VDWTRPFSLLRKYKLMTVPIKPGHIVPLDDPMFVGVLPVRAEIEVLPSDDPTGQKLVGFVCEFVEGGEVYLYDEITGTRTLIPSGEDLVVGSTVLVPGIFGYVEMKVTGADIAENDACLSYLFRARDSRRCWVSNTLINKSVVSKISYVS
jgi:hypothetical protein